ncbi:hypothetical protein B0H10DRAFT_526136 [Mycena sp. CBHHK59/15]|nr:hypothetical protein B0H10DRAFT_526136 [Mycena sp. CBHHK59/15]
MPFFSNSSGVHISGGTFYDAAGDVNVQNNQQLAIEATAMHLALDQGSSMPYLHIGWEEYPDARSFSGPARNNRNEAGAGRFLPYEAASRPHHSFQRSSEHHPYRSEYPTTSAISDSSSLFTPGTTHLPQNSVPLAICPPVFPPPGGGPSFPPSTNAQYPPYRNIPSIEYHPSDSGQVPSPFEDSSHMASESIYPSFRDTPPLHISAVHAHTPWQNMYPSQYEPVTTIHGGTFVGGNVNNTLRNGESGINILHRAVALEALHDAADSDPQPRCHPETRMKMLQKLENWCTNSEWLADSDSDSEMESDHSIDDEPETEIDANCGSATHMEPSILWLHGPAGAGKSAIMKTLSQRLEDTGRLGALFSSSAAIPLAGTPRFYSRPSRISSHSTIRS